MPWTDRTEFARAASWHRGRTARVMEVVTAALCALGVAMCWSPVEASAAGAPVVTSISPASGAIGTKVTVIGSGFSGATAVAFGLVPATGFLVTDRGDRLTVDAPAASSPGAVDITVTTSLGPSTATPADQFTYLAPSVTGVSPARGSFLGGTVVSIRGADLSGTTGVMFGDNPATNVTVVSPTKVSAVAPAFTPNAVSCCEVDITVTTPIGTSPVVASDEFDYVDWPTQSAAGLLSGVSCGAPTSCIAAGSYTNTAGNIEALVEQWDGSTWTTMPIANTGGRPPLSVSCATSSPTSCYVVGGGTSGGTPFIDGYNSTLNRWSTVPDLSVPGAGVLWGVSCSSDGFCMATGVEAVSTHEFPALSYALEPSGKWESVAPDNDLGDFTASDLEAVSCTSSQSCVAVGYYEEILSGVVQALAQVWNGTSWNEVFPPSSDGSYTSLSGVSCTGPSNCIAVGTTGTGAGAAPLIEQWDGTSWSVVSAPAVSGSLSSVSCSDASDCTAVGQAGDGIPLIESWDGNSWTVVSSPTPPGTSSFLDGVSCTSSENCVAVGQSTQQYVKIIGESYDTLQYTLTEVWNGSQWSIVPSPNS